MPTGDAHVSSLTVYPVKSFAGTPVDTLDIGAAGPLGDRRWMVLAPDGGTLTARTLPRMLAVRAEPTPDGGVTLRAPGLPTRTFPAPTGPPDTTVTMSRLSAATGAGPEADAWCTAALERPVRLVWLDDAARRGMVPELGGTRDDALALHDAGPMHLTTTASLSRLDAWAAEVHDEVTAAALEAGAPAPAPRTGLDMRRFRPNLVVDGDLEPFEEDGWRSVRVGDVRFRYAVGCDRCVMTTVDPDTTAVGREPLRTLARHRRWDRKLWFGIHVVPVRPGQIRVGDTVTVVS